jgi:hypothetical protein
MGAKGEGLREFSETSGRVAGFAKLHGSPGHSLSDSTADRTCVQRALDQQRNQNRPQNASRLQRYVLPSKGSRGSNFAFCSPLQCAQG